jgi:hypothetical protein
MRAEFAGLASARKLNELHDRPIRLHSGCHPVFSKRLVIGRLSGHLKSPIPPSAFCQPLQVDDPHLPSFTARQRDIVAAAWPENRTPLSATWRSCKGRCGEMLG